MTFRVAFWMPALVLAEISRHREHPRALLHYQHYNYDPTDDRGDDSLDFIRH
jgi:hypothetical protein